MKATTCARSDAEMIAGLDRLRTALKLNISFANSTSLVLVNECFMIGKFNNCHKTM